MTSDKSGNFCCHNFSTQEASALHCGSKGQKPGKTHDRQFYIILRRAGYTVCVCGGGDGQMDGWTDTDRLLVFIL